jgi:hypothetical protein
MILEAFSQVLRQEHYQGGPCAKEILHKWLKHILSQPFPHSQVDRVIYREIAMLRVSRKIAFTGRSATGECLLRSLYLYCESYERWQFRRWLHDLKPHNFNQLSQ